jgi:hypothetical protein
MHTMAERAFPVPVMHDPVIIADRREFVDALRLLRRGHVLVHACDSWGGCTVDGRVVQLSLRPLVDYGLVDEFDNPDGFEHVHYYRLNERGRAFADRINAAWSRRPWIERLAVRLLG